MWAWPTAPIAKAAANCLPVPLRLPDSRRCSKLDLMATLAKLFLTNCLMRQLRLPAPSASTWPRMCEMKKKIHQMCENNCRNVPWPTAPMHQPDTCDMLSRLSFIDAKVLCAVTVLRPFALPSSYALCVIFLGHACVHASKRLREL